MLHEKVAAAPASGQLLQGVVGRPAGRIHRVPLKRPEIPELSMHVPHVPRVARAIPTLRPSGNVHPAAGGRGFVDASHDLEGLEALFAADR